jgi:hypothetical protein
MPDLDDFELEHTGSPEGSPRPYRPDPEPEPEKKGGLLFPAILALAAILAIGLLAVVYVSFRTPTEREIEATPPPVEATSLATPAPSATPVTLPPLDASDDFVRQMVTALSSHPELGRWIAEKGLIMTLTAVTVNVATGESPRPHLLFLAPKTRFVPKRVGRSLVPDPASFAGYDVMADAVASVDATAAAQAYLTLEPLFDVAFQDFGMPEVRFRAMLERAIDNLVAVPDLPSEVALVPHATTFRYDNPRYEELSPAQKQFLRMGPRNVKVIRGKLQEFQAALKKGPEAPTPES